MLFNPENVPGVGQLILIHMDQNEDVRGEFDTGCLKTWKDYHAFFALYSPNFQTLIEYGVYMVILIQVTLFV